MLYDNDNYYLFSFVDGDFRIFHVDRMATVEQGTDERQGKEQFEKLDMPSFSKSTFCMYNGKEEHVEMVFHHRMIDIVIDKSG